MSYPAVDFGARHVRAGLDISALIGSHRPRLLISGALSRLSRLMPVLACVSVGRLLSGPFHGRPIDLSLHVYIVLIYSKVS